MRITLPLTAVTCLLTMCRWCGASTTGLNTIPTTDIVPPKSWIGQIQNGNTSLNSPTLFARPDLVLQTQYSLGTRIECGLDYIQPPDVGFKEIVFNIKASLQNENDWRPNVAFGIANVAARQRPGYFLTFSKTLNYAQEQAERFRAHHRRNRKLLGRRIHFGVMLDGYGTLQPFLGADLQLNDSTVFQADWINGSANAISAGLVYVLPDQRTVFNPAFLYSNSKLRVDGFFLNISHQFNLK